MPNCTATRIEFPAFKRRQIEAKFSGGAIASDGVGLLLRSVDRRLKLAERVAAQFLPDPRDPDKIQYQVVDLLRQRVYGLAYGYVDLNDHDTLIPAGFGCHSAAVILIKRCFNLPAKGYALVDSILCCARHVKQWGKGKLCLIKNRDNRSICDFIS